MVWIPFEHLYLDVNHQIIFYMVLVKGSDIKCMITLFEYYLSIIIQYLLISLVRLLHSTIFQREIIVILFMF